MKTLAALTLATLAIVSAPAATADGGTLAKVLSQCVGC